MEKLIRKIPFLRDLFDKHVEEEIKNSESEINKTRFMNNTFKPLLIQAVNEYIEIINLSYDKERHDNGHVFDYQNRSFIHRHLDRIDSICFDIIWEISIHGPKNGWEIDDSICHEFQSWCRKIKSTKNLNTKHIRDSYQDDLQCFSMSKFLSYHLTDATYWDDVKQFKAIIFRLRKHAN